jgi:hypothetical protein
LCREDKVLDRVEFGDLRAYSKVFGIDTARWLPTTSDPEFTVEEPMKSTYVPGSAFSIAYETRRADGRLNAFQAVARDHLPEGGARVDTVLYDVPGSVATNDPSDARLVCRTDYEYSSVFH